MDQQVKPEKKEVETLEEMDQKEKEQLKKDYVPDNSEKHLFHVLLDKPRFDSRTGKKLSTPFVQKFTKTEFSALTSKKNENDKSNADMLGYEVTVLWNPNENI